VLAHPLSLGLGASGLDRVLEELSAAGLGGTECYYGRYSPEERARLAETARRHHLVATGGSDFHGSFKPDSRSAQEPGTSTCRTRLSPSCGPQAQHTAIERSIATLSSLDPFQVFTAHCDAWQVQGRLREPYGGGAAEFEDGD